MKGNKPHIHLFCYRDKDENSENCEEHTISLESISKISKLLF